MRSKRLALCALGVLCAFAPAAADDDALLPPLVPLPKADASGYAPVNGVRLWYAEFGRGAPVVLVHGGLAGSWVWGAQVRALAAHYRVIVLDNRGHGHSTKTPDALRYDVMADDLLALLDYLHVEKTALVGWSDGADIGLDIAIRHPERLTKLFAFAGNTDPGGLIDATPTPRMHAFFARAERQYRAVSPTPDGFAALAQADGSMAESQPHFTAGQLGSIRVPTWIAGADHDQFVKRENTDFQAASIPGASELILPGVDHGAPQEDPELFNAALLRFLRSV